MEQGETRGSTLPSLLYRVPPSNLHRNPTRSESRRIRGRFGAIKTSFRSVLRCLAVRGACFCTAHIARAVREFRSGRIRVWPFITSGKGPLCSPPAHPSDLRCDHHRSSLRTAIQERSSPSTKPRCASLRLKPKRPGL